jgi:FhaA, N-terminal domain/FHA domain
VSVLRSIEGKIESLFEGVFGRAFRTHVQPVELARKLAKEMDDHRAISVSRVYVPNEYTIYLSPQDREQFESYENSLIVELQDYLSEQGRRERYALLTPPKVLMETDEDLELGEFGIATRMVQPKGRPEPDAEAPPAQEEPGATMVYKARAPEPTQAVTPDELHVERETVSLTVDGERHPLDKRSVVLGRSRDCDIRLSDPNVSRHHAEIRQEGATYWIVDLGSTNGLEVNGRRVKRAKLEDSDRVTLGSTELVFGRSFQ